LCFRHRRETVRRGPNAVHDTSLRQRPRLRTPPCERTAGQRERLGPSGQELRAAGGRAEAVGDARRRRRAGVRAGPDGARLQGRHRPNVHSARDRLLSLRRRPEGPLQRAAEGRRVSHRPGGCRFVVRRRRWRRYEWCRRHRPQGERFDAARTAAVAQHGGGRSGAAGADRGVARGAHGGWPLGQLVFRSRV